MLIGQNEDWERLCYCRLWWWNGGTSRHIVYSSVHESMHVGLPTD